MKQDITVSDAITTTRLGRIKLTSWMKIPAVPYNNVVVRQFCEQKYLSMAKSGSTIKKIQDIGDVIEYDPDIDEDNQR